MSAKHHTYRATWTPEYGEHVGLCTELPPVSRLASGAVIPAALVEKKRTTTE